MKLIDKVVAAIPQELKEREQWVCWQEEIRDDKPTKVLKNPRTGYNAKANDPSTWSPYGLAIEAKTRYGFTGIGFVFSRDGSYCGVDLDKCRNPETEVIEPWAMEIIQKLDSYTEISPSGRGVHVIIKGSVPEGGNRKGHIEMYDRDRYFTVTGEHLPGTPLTIEERQRELEVLHAEIFKKQEPVEPIKQAPAVAPNVSDADLIEKMRNADNGHKFDNLWRGDWTGYPSQSEADMALCSMLAFWTGKDAARMDSLFRQSGLYRKKWDTSHYSGGKTYGQGVIDKAISTTNEVYNPSSFEPEKRVSAASLKADVGILLSEVETEQVEWIWKGFLAHGKLAVIDGDPGLGKSTATLDIAARISTGRNMPDGSAGILASGVVLISAEDGIADTIKPRLEAAEADCSKIVVLQVVPDENGEDRPITLPGDLPVVRQAIERVDAKLVVIDPLMAFLDSKTKSNSDQDIRRALYSVSANIAEPLGVAVLVVRHLNKSGAGKSIYRGGGSIGIIGAARSGFLVDKDPSDPNRRVLASTKCNLAKMPESLSFYLQDAGGVARVVWDGISPHTADELLVASSETDQDKGALADAESFLLEILEGGPVPVKDILKQAKDAGISDRTLRRAKEKLGIISDKLGGPGTAWVWELPKVASLSIPPNLGNLSEFGNLNSSGAMPNPEYAVDNSKDCQTSKSNSDGNLNAGTSSNEQTELAVTITEEGRHVYDL